MDFTELFSADLIARMTLVHDVLRDVLPTNGLDEWIGGFVGEARPANEVRIFEAIAVVYQELTDKPDIPLGERKRLYLLLVMGASGYTMECIEEGLPENSPGYAELMESYERAFALNARPRQPLSLSSVMDDLFDRP